MRCVYQADHLIDAHLVLHRLQDAGIRAEVLGGYLTGALGDLPVMGLVRVVVSDEDEAQALTVLAVDEPAAEEPSFDPALAGVTRS